MVQRFSGALGVAVTGALAFSLTALLPAQGHPGHDEAEPPPPDALFQKVTLNDHPGEPMDLAVLPDGGVLHTTRAGEVWLHDRAPASTSSPRHRVYEHDEEGLQGIAIDPKFDGRTTGSTSTTRRRWTPRSTTPPHPTSTRATRPTTGTAADFAPFKGAIRLSRFRLVNGKTLDLGTEQKIIDVPRRPGHLLPRRRRDRLRHARATCTCRPVTTPTRSPPTATPRSTSGPNRNPAYDAQRTAANTNDLRGKMLRIKAADGGYTIPAGNLFARARRKTRPEIYAMGLRNPFRFELDPAHRRAVRRRLLAGRQDAEPARGPAGQGRWVAVDKPANYGWPYCATPTCPTSTTTSRPATPARRSTAPRRSTSRRTTPACASCRRSSSRRSGTATPPSARVPRARHRRHRRRWPARPTSTTRATPRATRWPAEYYDGMPLFYEWTRDYVKGFRLDAAATSSAIETVLPVDRLRQPDGHGVRPGRRALRPRVRRRLLRREPRRAAVPDRLHRPGRQPHARCRRSRPPRPTGTAPLTGGVLQRRHHRRRRRPAAYAWDFDTDGTVDARAPNPSYTYTENGIYRATLKVTDVGGRHRGGRLGRRRHRGRQPGARSSRW